MAKKAPNNDQLIAHIIKGIEEVKGNDIDILDLRQIENTVCDYFIICNGTSNTQVNAIVNSIQKTVSKRWRKRRMGAFRLCKRGCTRFPKAYQRVLRY